MAVITSNSITFIDNTGVEKYLYIRYSNDGVTFTANNGLTPGEWLGTCTTNSIIAPVNFSDYTWSKIKGQDGKDATTYYTWIKYADDANGTNMSDSPDGKEYMGIAYNKEVSTESNIASDYIWSLIKGSNGTDGDDGVTYYTWVKYADDDVGNGMSDDPSGKEYIGISYNNLDSNESNNPDDYTWSLFKGKDGIDGKTGVAGKGIKSITEYYLISEYNTGITRSHKDWSKDIPTLNSIEKYLWNYEETIFVIEEYDASGNIIKKEETDESEPIIIGVYGEDGSSLQIKYISSAVAPVITNNDVSTWLDVVPTPIDGQKVYMTQKLSTGTDWSTPIQISAVDGKANVAILDGYWYINGESTGIKAEGADGVTPSIGENGNWYINGIDSGIKAQGEAGKDGADIEYVYYRSKNATTLSAPTYTNGVLTSGWMPSPQGITETYKYEYVSVRNKPSGGNWSKFSSPSVWSKWGEKGQDGDGVEYKYYLSNSSDAPTYSSGDKKWTDDPTGVSIGNQYEYVVQIKIINGAQTVSTPALWAKFGEDGNGITSVVNYYNVTPEPTPPSTWETAPPAMTIKNKYLWNYEEIIYTNGDKKTTDPAIIGIRGDNGKDGADGAGAVDFQIYSVDGFEFSDDKQTITLKTVALKSGEVVSGAKYQWSWWNKDLESGAAYENISSATSSTLTISATSPYAFADIKCTMTYDGNVYEDHVTLTEKTVVYTSIVKFFDGNNVFHENDHFLVAYVELYQNNKKVDGANDVNKYYNGIVTVSSGIISGATGSFTNGDKMYFIYQDGGLYKVALGQYNSGTWRVVDMQQNYTYTNSLYPTIKSNIIAISKESINKSANIDFIIYKDNIEVARTSANVIDSNDPIISGSQPANAVHGQLWLDTSKTPYTLWIYEKQNANDAGKWVECSEKIGGAVFTSRPSRYFAGDLWILGANESCGSFGPGSMLKATVDSIQYSESHWIDADVSSTDLKNNIKQYFKFDKNTGLRIGQSDNKFYVNISSTRMGFCENPNVNSAGQEEFIDPNEVVSISNKSATIQNTKLKGNTEFYGQINICDPKSDPTDSIPDTLFVWKIEQDGSLSLAHT